MLKSRKQTSVLGDVRDSEHFCYICTKKSDAGEQVGLHWQDVQDEIVREQNEEQYEDDEEMQEEE